MNRKHEIIADLRHGFWLLCWSVVGLGFTMLLAHFTRREGIYGLGTPFALVLGIAASEPRRRQVAAWPSAVRSWVVSKRALRARLVVRPPGARLNRLTQLIWSEKTCTRVFQPAYADLVAEWQAAEAAGDLKLARSIRYLRAPWVMGSHMLLQILAPLLAWLWRAAN